MISTETAATVAGALGIAFVSALSVPASLTIYARFGPGKSGHYHSLGTVYEDEDGKASEESQKKFSTIVPRIVTLVAAALGGLIAISSAVLETLATSSNNPIGSWLRAICWVCPQSIPTNHYANNSRSSLSYSRSISSSSGDRRQGTRVAYSSPSLVLPLA